MEHLSCFLGCLAYLIGFSSSEVGAVDRILFQVPEMVVWSEAERTCQKNNGKLFQPSETSFDVSLFSECNSNDDLWVAAKYIYRINAGSDSRDSPFIRCEMCKIEKSCGITCLYKECWNRCNVVCQSQYDPLTHVRYDQLQNWTGAMQWCSQQGSTLGDKMQNASSLFFHGYCFAGCFWTRNLIQVQLKTEQDSWNNDGECGILHNGTLAFTSCSAQLHPLCERVATTTLETPSLSFTEGNSSCRLINNNITSTYGTSTVANESTKQTTFGLTEDLSSLFVPVGDSPHKSENGGLIGGVVGAGVVLTIIIVILVVFLLRRSKQNRNRNWNSQGPVNHDNVLKTKMHMHDAYDDVNGEVTYSDKHTSIPIQHLERESITYATPSNVNGSSEIVQDKYSGIITNGKQMTTVLYSEVQKRPNAGQNLHNMNQSMVGDDEYDKIKFDTSYAQQAEHAVNIYDKTNVGCEHREEYFENVYNKAEFYHECQSMDAVDVYDKANFHGRQQEKRSENTHSDEENASPGQISENLYDKADFHRRPQDEPSGYL